MAFINATKAALQHARARVLLVGSGRMGHIRAKALYSNPRFEFCGIVDSNVKAAGTLSEIYLVRRKNLLFVYFEHFRTCVLIYFCFDAIHDFFTRRQRLNHSPKRLPNTTTVSTESSYPPQLQPTNLSSQKPPATESQFSLKSPSTRPPPKPAPSSKFAAMRTKTKTSTRKFTYAADFNDDSTLPTFHFTTKSNPIRLALH